MIFNKYTLPSLFAISTLALACGGSGGECERAFEKEMECIEDEAERKEAQEFKGVAIASCKQDKEDPQVQAAIKCSKESSCDAFRECKSKIRAEGRAKEGVAEIEKQIADGKAGEALGDCLFDVDTYNSVPEYKAACDKAFAVGLDQMEADDAMSKCTYNLDNYKTIPTFKTACDALFTKSFADLSSEDAKNDARYSCTTRSDAKEWMEASEAFKTGCVTMKDGLKAEITKQRDEGGEYSFSNCSTYKDLVTAVTPDDSTAADTLCKEADIADDAKETLEKVAANIAEEKANLPWGCKSFLEKKSELGDSEWFAAKSKEVAKACYGDLGKLVLAKVSSYCPQDAKDTRAFAEQFGLSAEDAELKKLIDKTAKKCK